MEVTQNFIDLHNKNPESDIRGRKLKEQRGRGTSHWLLPLSNP